MKIIEKETGKKIPYEEMGSKIFFNDELMINLSKYERDFEQTLDICADENNCLAMGLATRYVAQVIIPPRQYSAPVLNPQRTEGDTMQVGDMISEAPKPLPLNMNEVTLILWNVEDYINEQ